jgi:hypothetical protein
MAKGRESGMPDEAYGQTFFNPECIVSKLDCGGAFITCVAGETSASALA